MRTPELIVLVGLTGVGKSTAVDALLASVPGARLLPNRRDLTDRIVIPEAQRADGRPPTPVRDRLERFRLTARYRRDHPAGMAYALERYLLADGAALADATLLLFDNLRGDAEVDYAVDVFPGARFIVLDAPVATRLLRLAGRNDAFDRIADADQPPAGALLERLQGVPGLARLTDLEALAAAAEGLDPDAVETGARVVAEESLHYDTDGAWGVLEPLPPGRRIRLDSGRLGAADVVDRLRAWL